MKRALSSWIPDDHFWGEGQAGYACFCPPLARRLPWEDGLFGDDRGDEVPEHLRSEEGRRAAFKAAKERLAQKAGRGEEPQVAGIEPDPEQFGATRGWGRRTWHREAHKQLLRQREQDARPIARGRAERLLEALHRLQENQQVEIQASEAYERWQAHQSADQPRSR